MNSQHVAPFCKLKEFAFFKPGDVAPSGADKRSPSVNRLQGAFQARHLCRIGGDQAPRHQVTSIEKGLKAATPLRLPPPPSHQPPLTC